MGEQSMKQLRGKSREDIIFAGTHGHPPLNMTEVSLTLLNDNGSAPEELRDYAEIQLTPAPVSIRGKRLFFEQTGLAGSRISTMFSWEAAWGPNPMPSSSRATSVPSPMPDRRSGGLFHRRGRRGHPIQDTQDPKPSEKSQATNQNLLRLSDIIAEVKHQMAGLKRQAKKAETYQKNAGPQSVNWTFSWHAVITGSSHRKSIPPTPCSSRFKIQIPRTRPRFKNWTLPWKRSNCNARRKTRPFPANGPTGTKPSGPLTVQKMIWNTCAGTSSGSMPKSQN